MGIEMERYQQVLAKVRTHRDQIVKKLEGLGVSEQDAKAADWDDNWNTQKIRTAEAALLRLEKCDVALDEAGRLAAAKSPAQAAKSLRDYLDGVAADST